jgi:uncharacterized protein involved in copper resistance
MMQQRNFSRFWIKTEVEMMQQHNFSRFWIKTEVEMMQQHNFSRFWMLVEGRFSSSEPRRRSASISLRGASASSS